MLASVDQLAPWRLPASIVWTLGCWGLCVACGCSGRVGTADYASVTVDLGMVVSDLDKSAKFYTQVLGFTEVGDFKIPADLAADSGLTAGEPFAVRVFMLSKSPTATKLKLIQMAAPATENKFMEGGRGVRFLTFTVNDTDAAVKRAAAAGVKPVAKGPVKVADELAKGQYITVFHDPDGNLIELVGPKPEPRAGND